MNVRRMSHVVLSLTNDAFWIAISIALRPTNRRQTMRIPMFVVSIWGPRADFPRLQSTIALRLKPTENGTNRRSASEHLPKTRQAYLSCLGRDFAAKLRRQPISLVNVFRRVQTCSDVFRRVQTCSDVFRRVQTCSDVFRRVQTCLPSN